MIRLILILSVALLASLTVNGCQWRKAMREADQRTLASENSALKDGAAKAGKIASVRLIDDELLLAATRTVEVDKIQTIRVYEDRVTQLPAPTCSPGAARVDAWNTITGE